MMQAVRQKFIFLRISNTEGLIAGGKCAAEIGKKTDDLSDYCNPRAEIYNFETKTSKPANFPDVTSPIEAAAFLIYDWF